MWWDTHWIYTEQQMQLLIHWLSCLHDIIYSLSGSKFWAVICKHPSIGTQQLIRITGNNQYLVGKLVNVWLLNFQKSGPNSPPLPETMPPPSWGAQGTRDVRYKSLFSLVSIIIVLCEQVLKGRNSLTTPGSRETITGPPNSGAIYANVGQVLFLILWR